MKQQLNTAPEFIEGLAVCLEARGFLCEAETMRFLQAERVRLSDRVSDMGWAADAAREVQDEAFRNVWR